MLCIEPAEAQKYLPGSVRPSRFEIGLGAETRHAGQAVRNERTLGFAAHGEDIEGNSLIIQFDASFRELDMRFSSALYLRTF